MQTKTKTYVVTGATGHIGNRLAKGLLAAGHQVRVLSRDESRVAELVAQGAKAYIGQPEDAAYLTRAFQGADAVFAMLPPNYGAPNYRAQANVVGEAIYQALKATKIRHVVNLSSLGAELSEGSGPIKGLHDQEQRLNKLVGTNMVHLRPTYFMENLFFTLAPIREMGIAGSPLKPELKIPMIATQDIADDALQLLLNLDFQGVSVRELLGERDLSMAEVTRVLAVAADKPELKYVQFPYDAAEQAMTQGGLSPDTAKQLVEMYAAYNEGGLKSLAPRSKASTTATSIEDFAQGFAQAINA